MKKLDILVMMLLIIGGINWGFWGVVDFNIIDYVFGKIWIDKVLYFLIGISAVYALVGFKRMCKCSKSKK